MENVCSIYQMYAYVQLDRSKGGVKKKNFDASAGSSGNKPKIRPKPNTIDASQEGEDPAFDQWIRSKLQELYEPVLREQIPDRLVAIIEAHRKKKLED